MSDEQHRLESWKEIGAYLHRDARTVRRWEREEMLPVHRHGHKKGSSVYAYPKEIDAWRAGRRVAVEPPFPVRPWRQPLSIGITSLLCLVMTGNGIRPQSASAKLLKQISRQVWTSSNLTSQGVTSTDGRFLSFTDWETGDLAIRDLVSGTQRHLTSTEGWETSGDYADDSVISPDGTQVAYSWFVRKDSKYELRILPTLGVGPAKPRVLSRSDGFADYMIPRGWSSDGKQLMAVQTLANQTTRIGMFTLADGQFRAVKTVRAFNPMALSPDGRWIAYGTTPNNNTQLGDVYVIATDGSQETAVVQNPANDVPMAWSPDGSRLLFLSDRTGTFSLWSVAIAAGKPNGLPQLLKADTGPIGGMGMTRDGTFLYIVASSQRRNIYGAEVGPDQRLRRPPVLASERFVNSNFGARLSPDKKSIAYYSFRPGPAYAFVVIKDLNTNAEREISIKLRIAAPQGLGPMWFPDGRSLLVASNEWQTPGYTFNRLNLETGMVEPLLRVTRNLTGFKLSPDGKVLYTIESENSDVPDIAGTHLVTHDLSSQRASDVRAGDWITELAVSADSRQIAYVASEQHSPASFIAVIPAAGGTPREVFRASSSLLARYGALEWAPDQQRLLFVMTAGSPNGPNALWNVPVEGGRAEQVGPSLSADIRSPQLDSSGRIFFTAFEKESNELWELENFLPARITGR